MALRHFVFGKRDADPGAEFELIACHARGGEAERCRAWAARVSARILALKMTWRHQACPECLVQLGDDGPWAYVRVFGVGARQAANFHAFLLERADLEKVGWQPWSFESVAAVGLDGGRLTMGHRTLDLGGELPLVIPLAHPLPADSATQPDDAAGALEFGDWRTIVTSAGNSADTEREMRAALRQALRLHGPFEYAWIPSRAALGSQCEDLAQEFPWLFVPGESYLGELGNFARNGEPIGRLTIWRGPRYVRSGGGLGAISRVPAGSETASAPQSQESVRSRGPTGPAPRRPDQAARESEATATPRHVQPIRQAAAQDWRIPAQSAAADTPSRRARSAGGAPLAAWLSAFAIVVALAALGLSVAEARHREPPPPPPEVGVKDIARLETAIDGLKGDMAVLNNVNNVIAQLRGAIDSVRKDLDERARRDSSEPARDPMIAECWLVRDGEGVRQIARDERGASSRRWRSVRWSDSELEPVVGNWEELKTAGWDALAGDGFYVQRIKGELSFGSVFSDGRAQSGTLKGLPAGRIACVSEVLWGEDARVVAVVPEAGNASRATVHVWGLRTALSNPELTRMLEWSTNIDRPMVGLLAIQKLVRQDSQAAALVLAAKDGWITSTSIRDDSAGSFRIESWSTRAFKSPLSRPDWLSFAGPDRADAVVGYLGPNQADFLAFSREGTVASFLETSGRVLAALVQMDKLVLAMADGTFRILEIK